MKRLRNSYSMVLLGIPVILLSGGCSFVDPPYNPAPEIKLNPAAQILRTSAVLSADVVKGGGDATFECIRFRYTTSGSDSWVETQDAAVKASSASVLVSDLYPDTEYRYYALGITPTATIESSALTFTTQPLAIPTVGEARTLSSGATSLVAEFTILSDGGTVVYEAGFEVKEISQGATAKFKLPLQTIPAGTYSLSVTSLSPDRTYSVTPYAVNSVGTAVGEGFTFEAERAFVVDQPGELQKLLEDSELPDTQLTVSGPLNGDDFRFIHSLFTDSSNTLTELDLSDVTICEGGGAYDGIRYTYANTVSTGLFSNLPRLRRIELPLSTVRIMLNAFAGCTGLSTLAIPDRVESVYPSEGCTALKEITLPGAAGRFGIEEGVLYSADYTALIWYPQGKGAVFTVPATVTGIGSRAFYGVPFTSLTVMAAEPPEVASDAFAASVGQAEIFGSCRLLVPASSLSLYRSHAVWGKFTTIEAL